VGKEWLVVGFWTCRELERGGGGSDKINIAKNVALQQDPRKKRGKKVKFGDKTSSFTGGKKRGGRKKSIG